MIDELRQKIAWVERSKSFRTMLRRHYHMPIEDDTIGWTLTMFKEHEIPDIEIYIDELCKAASYSLREAGIDDDGAFVELITNIMSECLVHELCHYMGVSSEDEVDAAVRAIFDSTRMWNYIPCPLKQQLVTWEECLKCDDLEKSPKCPLRRIREDAHSPDRYKPQVYHVTELQKVRYSFYERWHETSMDWDRYMAMFWGRAVGEYVEGLYPEGNQEVEVNVTGAQLAEFYGREPSELDDFTVTGHIDLLDKEQLLLMELKTQYNLRYVKDGPSPFHRWQVLAYYTLGLIQYPEIFENLKFVKVLYWGRNFRGATMPPYVEHEVAMQSVDLLTPGRMFRESEISGEPPEIMCVDWLCRYCDHKELCKGNIGRPEE